MGKKTSKTITALESQVAQQHTALEQSYSTYTLLARQVEDLMYMDLAGPPVEGRDEILPSARSTATIMRIRRLRHENPIAKQAVKLSLRFVFGKGVSYLVKDENISQIVGECWNDPVNQALLTSHKSMKRRFDELLTDGEWFLVMFEAPEAPHVRFGRIPMEEIVDILYDPDNAEMPVWYKRKFIKKTFDPEGNNGEGQWKSDTKATIRYYRNYAITDDMLTGPDGIEARGLVIPEEKVGDGVVKHMMINEVRGRTGLRGISELFSSREWFRVFKQFMEDRGAINAQANALSMQRKIKGGPTAVRALSGRIGGVKVQPDADDQLMSPDAFLRPIGPGSTIDTNENVDWKSIRADTGAANAVQDARMLLAAGGAGVATSINYFGESSGALAAAQVMELPMVKGYEDWQSFHKTEFQEIIEFVLSVALGRPAKDDEKQIAWEFPPLISQDVVKYITAFAQWAQQIAPGNRKVKLLAIRGGMTVLQIPGLEANMKEIETEEERLFQEKQAQLKLQQDAAQKALNAPTPVPGQLPPHLGGPPVGPAANSNGNGNGQKAGGGPQPDAFSPGLRRLVGGRPPADGPTGPRTRRNR